MAGDPFGPVARAAARARGRFTRNFVVQATAAEWALTLLAILRNELADLRDELGGLRDGPAGLRDGPAGLRDGPAGLRDGPAVLRGGAAGSPAELVFFQHDEVVVHCPAAQAERVAGLVHEATGQAGRLLFGDTPVRFPLDVSVVECYADAA